MQKAKKKLYVNYGVVWQVVLKAKYQLKTTKKGKLFNFQNYPNT